MNVCVRRFGIGWAAVLLATFVIITCVSSIAQDSSGHDSDLNLALHANSHATATDIGLPTYPGATVYHEKDNDSSLDLGFTFGDVHFTVVAVSYLTDDSPERVLDFYRKPLSHYGEVLECYHGKPVGKLSITNTGLTCEDEHGGHVHVDGNGNSSNDRELRVGTPHKYRIVGIDDAKSGKTHFGLVYLELPRDKDKKPE